MFNNPFRQRDRPERALEQRQYVPEHRPYRSRAQYYTQIANQNLRYFRYLIDKDERVRASQISSDRYDYTEPLSPLEPQESQEGSTDVVVKTPIYVVPADSLDTAEQLLAEEKKDIVVLNMANATSPGGAYLHGAGAQEEALCRRTTLYLTICPERKFHPIPNHGAIYSPDVLVVRKSDQEDCLFLEPTKTWWTSVISVAAIVRPPLNASGTDFARRQDREETRERIRTLLRVAAREGKTNLVLSALGCGAFSNPPKAVANLFKEVLKEKEFRRRFQGIWFSILDRKGSRNYEIYRKVLDGLSI
jgi:uncharacterized protein (TIGR02452 family)